MFANGKFNVEEDLSDRGRFYVLANGETPETQDEHTELARLFEAAPQLLALAEWVAMGEHHPTCRSIVCPTGPDAALCCDCQVGAARQVIAKTKNTKGNAI